jgi:8-oxo-dGTP pyrophosphatase MutT (NUDIX family)
LDDVATTELSALTRRHRCDGDDEREHQLRTLDWLARAPRPFDRDCFDPGHATGSGFVVSEDGRVGLIFHDKLKLWVQPGGHAEAGETDIAVVAARETGEELGLTIDRSQFSLFDIDVHRVAPFDDAPAHLHFDYRFLYVLPAVDLSGGGDAHEAKWFTRAELSSMGLDPGLKRMLRKAQAAGIVGG